MEQVKIFLDTDVIISALLSKTGASFEVIENSKVRKIISKAVRKEVEEVTKRLNIGSQVTKRILKKIRIISLNLTKTDIAKSYQEYIFDEKDSHIVAGACISKSKFLLTHNIRHYKVNKINTDFGIIVLNPGNFLQYLGSLDKF